MFEFEGKIAKLSWTKEDQTTTKKGSNTELNESEPG
jgi:hypothetical protein